MTPEQLNQIKVRHENATDAEFIGYARGDVGKLLAHVEQIEQRAERAEKAASEMRDLLQSAKPYREEWLNNEAYQKYKDQWETCIDNSTAGQTYLSPAKVRELVKPLVEAAINMREWLCSNDGFKHVNDIPDRIYIPFYNALRYAREKGWCE